MREKKIVDDFWLPLTIALTMLTCIRVRLSLSLSHLSFIEFKLQQKKSISLRKCKQPPIALTQQSGKKFSKSQNAEARKKNRGNFFSCAAKRFFSRLEVLRGPHARLIG